MMTEKLNDAQRHILRLALRDAGPDGWVKLSKTVLPFVQTVPEDLREIKTEDGQHFVRLTDQGKAVVLYS